MNASRVRRTLQLALLALILGFILLGLERISPGLAQGDYRASIDGEVRSKATGQPVAGALVEVSLLGLSARTDQQGRFAWIDIPLAEPIVRANIAVSAPPLGAWQIEGVRIVADDTLMLNIDLKEAPTRLVVPEVLPERPRPALPEVDPAIPLRLEPGEALGSFPQTIRVRVTGNANCDTSAPYTVETVNFMEYVMNVLPNEWPGGWPGQSYRAGAMAVKMYAWYWIAQGGKWDDADVYDSTCDQVYIPGVSYSSTNNAINHTWNWLLTRGGSLISIHYLDTSARCNDYGWADCIGQWDTYWHALGNNGYEKLTWDEMLFKYFKGTALSPVMPPPPAGFALRFYGNGNGDIDRVKIPIDPQVPVDIGGDFTLEWWMKARIEDNQSSACASGANEDWINGNIVFDRDVFGAGDYGDYGVSLAGGRIAFGVNNGSESYTICGTAAIADGRWHHVAVTRAATGEMSIFIDGQIDSQGVGPTGDISYRDGRSSSYPNSDPYLVIGAEKHDAGPEYPSFNGWIDEMRLSSSIRYTTDFSPPESPFTTDSDTVGLYHFDEGFGNALNDSSGAPGGPSTGQRSYGGVINGPEWMLSDLFLPYKVFFPYVSN